MIAKYKWYIIGAVVIILGLGYYFIQSNKAEYNAGKTTELVEEAIQKGELAKAEALISAYTSHKEQYLEDLGNVKVELNNAYLEKGDYDKLFEGREFSNLSDDDCQEYYDIICKCIDKMKQNGNKEEMRSFIDRKVGFYKADFGDEWRKDNVQKRLYKYAGIK